MNDNKILLSILIPTVVGREETFDRLCSVIDTKLKFTEEHTFTGQFGWQCGNIEVCVIKDDKEMTIGEKRARLYNMAKGVYSWQIDDDDTIEFNAIEKILEAINEGNDCITFKERCEINGQFFSSNHSLRYAGWANNQDGYDYVRTPFFKSVIKTEIAKSVPIPFIRWNEDEQWANELKPYLKTETHLDEWIYFYIHNSTNPTERYGLDKD